MKLGIMQPYFFPYAGYFDVILKTDEWVVFDVVKYNARSWMNRNRILHPTMGDQYLTVPVERAPTGTPVNGIRLKDKGAARARVLGQLGHYRGQAPFFEPVTALVRAAFDTAPTDRLVDVNVAGLAAVCDYLGIPFRWRWCSDLGIDPATVAHSGQWALRIASRLGADTYLNPSGGRAIFDPQEWADLGIALRFTELPRLHYRCGRYGFVDHLSIIDVLMWLPPGAVVDTLASHGVHP